MFLQAMFCCCCKLCRSQIWQLAAIASEFDSAQPCVIASHVLQHFAALAYSLLTSALISYASLCKTCSAALLYPSKQSRLMLRYFDLFFFLVALVSTFVSRGRRGTWRHWPWLCVASIALGDIHVRFAWQALHLLAHATLSHTQTSLSHTHTSLSHTIFHTQLSHSHASLCHTQLCHTLLFHTPSLSHTTLSHTIFHAHLCHTQSHTHTHIFVTHHLSHTTSSHTTFSLIDHPPPRLSCLPRPAATLCSDYWKKLTCGVIRSFNLATTNQFGKDIIITCHHHMS